MSNVYNDGLFQYIKNDLEGGCDLVACHDMSANVDIITQTNHGFICVIEDSAFANHAALKSVRMPLTLQKIGNEAFFSCKMLETVFMPFGVEVIGDRAFADCTSITKILIPSTVKKIGADTMYEIAFDDCGTKKLMATYARLKRV